MITLEEYLADPCGSLSIPYWKWRGMKLPEDMKILHHREFVPLEGYRDEVYFRLRHDLRHLEAPSGGVELRRMEQEDFPAAAEIIRCAYPGIAFGVEQLETMMETPVYAPNLWLMARVEGKAAGCIIADLARAAGEGILEWVQVLPEYRRRGVGKAMVLEVLRRMDADFATVSGKVNDANCPEALYRACGFKGQDVWHILHKL